MNKNLVPSTKTSIEIKLNQNDLIDLMEGSAEELILIKIDEMVEEQKSLKNKKHTLEEKIDEMLKNKQKNLAPSWIQELSKALNTELKMKLDKFFDHEAHSYSAIDLHNVGNRRRPATRREVTTVNNENVPNEDGAGTYGITWRVSYSQGNDAATGTHYLTGLTVPANIRKKISQLREIILAQITCKIELGELEYEYYLIQEGGKRNKAKVLRRILSETVEGKEILKLTK